MNSGEKRILCASIYTGLYIYKYEHEEELYLSPISLVVSVDVKHHVYVGTFRKRQSIDRQIDRQEGRQAGRQRYRHTRGVGGGGGGRDRGRGERERLTERGGRQTERERGRERLTERY